MKLREIRVQRFRNLADAAVPFPGERVFFLGRNGQGKTNLLEAIGYVSALRAFRPGDNRTLIAHGAEEAALGYVIEHEKLGRSEVVARIRPRGKEALFDGSPVRRLSELIGRFPSVWFASEDIQLVRGSPAVRRRWLDLHLASLDPAYLEALQSYHRALAQRNRLLKQEAKSAELRAFEEQMARSAGVLIKIRGTALARLEDLAARFHRALAEEAEQLTVIHRPDLENADAAALAAAWEQQRPRDLQMKSTQRGPHRDDISLQLDSREAALFASEGQQRTLVLALRFAQLRDARARSGVAPVVLADDVLGELDPGRRERFWQALDADLQLFATGTTLPAGLGEGWEIFGVAAGRVSRS